MKFRIQGHDWCIESQHCQKIDDCVYIVSCAITLVRVLLTKANYSKLNMASFAEVASLYKFDSSSKLYLP